MALFSVHSLRAADDYWVGGNAGGATDFNIAGNWSLGTLPTLYNSTAGTTNGDRVVLDGAQPGLNNKTPTMTGAYGTGTAGATWGLLGLKFVDSGWTFNTGANTLYLSYRGGYAIRAENTSGTNTINGNIRFGAFNTNAGSQPIVYVENGGTLRLNSSIGIVVDGGSSNSGGLEKYGLGTLELNTTGTWGGGLGLTAYEGTVKFFGETAGGVTGNGFGGYNTIYNIPMNVLGGKVDLNGAVPTLTVQNLTFSSGEITNSSGTTETFSVRQTVTRTWAGLISGNLNLAVLSATNSPTTTISGINTYTGTTSIQNASNGTNAVNTVVVTQNVLSGQSSPLGNSTTAITLGSTGNSALHAALLTNGAIEIGRDITLAASTNAASNHILGAHSSQTGDSVYSGTITIGTGLGGSTLDVTAPAGVAVSFTGNIVESAGTGQGTPTKIGAGTVRFAGTNSYLGATTVSAGTLLIDGDQTSATGAVTVASVATLGGKGIVGGATTVNGTLSPGASTGLLTFASNLTLADGSGTLMEINGINRGAASNGYDAVTLNTAGGVLNYDGTLTFSMTGAISDGTYDLFAFTASPTGTFDSIVFAGGYYSGSFVNDAGTWTALSDQGQTFSFSQLTGDLIVFAVPEPGMYAAFVGLGVLALGVIRRRRR